MPSLKWACADVRAASREAQSATDKVVVYWLLSDGGWGDMVGSGQHGSSEGMSAVSEGQRKGRSRVAGQSITSARSSTHRPQQDSIGMYTHTGHDMTDQCTPARGPARAFFHFVT